MSQDPIGENGGANLYAMVGNDPINKWDDWGLKWNIDRKGGPRANVCSDETTDTIGSLSTKIGLDADESPYWLKDSQGTGITPSNFKHSATYTIPNTIVLTVGDVASSEIGNDIAFLNMYASKLAAKGYSLAKYIAPEYRATSIKNSLAGDDVTGWVYSGHGNDNSISFWRSGESNMYSDQAMKYQKMASETSDPQKREFYLNQYYNLMNLAENIRRNSIVNAQDIGGLRKFEFSYLVIMGCSVDQSGQFSSIVAPAGAKFLPTEKFKLSRYSNFFLNPRD